MIPEPRHLIAALHKILGKLELTEAPGRDKESLVELQRILMTRIHDLENDAAIPTRAARLAEPANNPE